MHLTNPKLMITCDTHLEYVLISDPSPHRIPGRRRPNRIRDHAPRLPVVPRQLDPVCGRDVSRVPARDDPVRRDVLPFRAELPEFPVLPRRAAVGREAPAVADGTVPDLPARSEAERMHEIPRNRVGGSIAG